MGFSARYHAASLAAVFLALAIGILIGVGFGGDLIEGTAEDLERSLESDLTEARAEVDDLTAELDREREVGGLLYPAVVGERLRGERVAIVALGSLSEEISADIEEALDATGARLGEVAVVGVPPDTAAAVDALAGARGRTLPRGEALSRAAVRAGEALVRGGPRFDRARETVLSRFSGAAARIDAVVLVRELPDDLGLRAAEDTDRFADGLIEGMRSAGAVVVGAERSDDEPSSVPAFEESGMPSVDDLDLLAGKVALVLTLAGAEGSFGVKETADALLPELLPPFPAPQR